MSRPLALLLLLFALAGCRGGEGVSCEEAAQAFVDLTEEELEEEGDVKALEEARAGLPGVKARLTEVCKSREWDEATRACIAEARNPEALEACRPEEAPRQGEDPGTR